MRRYLHAISNGIQMDKDNGSFRMVQEFVEKVIIPQEQEYDTTMEYPTSIFNQAWELDLCNTIIPKTMGGCGYTSVQRCQLKEQLAYGCTGIAMALETNNLGIAPVAIAGTKRQQQYYLGQLLDAPRHASYCVTEPNAGSDVAAVRTKAIKCGEEWIINGAKSWISGAAVADWFFVLAKTDATAPTRSAFTGFIVDATTPGITIGKKEINLGQRCSDTRSVYFEDVVVPNCNVLGSPGSGFKLVMKAFDLTRPAIASGALGLATRAADTIRQAVSSIDPISDQAISFTIADMYTGVEASRLLIQQAAELADQQKRNTMLSSMAKQFTADQCNQIVHQAFQLYGKPSVLLEKWIRDAKIYQIYGGTSEIQRLIIAKALFTSAS